MDSSRCFQIGQTRMIIQSTERRGGNWVLNCKYLTPGIGPNNSEETIEGSLVLRDPVTNQISLGSSGLRSESSFGRLIKTGEVEIEFANLNSQTGFSELELYHIREELVGIDVREVDYEVTE